MYERLKKLCEDRGLNITQLCYEVTHSSGNLSTWKKGYMRSDYLSLVADKLQCSTDYLLGRTDNPNLTATDTYINGDNNNNATQAINGSVSVTASSGSGRKDTLTEQFIQKFEQLDFDEKVDVMQYVKDIKKSAAPQDG